MNRLLLGIALWALSLHAVAAVGPDWTQTFLDDFSGAANTGPSAAVWGYDTSACAWPQNSELQQYTFDRRLNVRQDGAGSVIIEARQEGGFCAPYTSGRINTSGKWHSQYGKFEARLRVPPGNGFWPAFWMIGSNIGSVSWPACGEIDIMEQRGDMTTRNQGSFHGTNYSGGSSKSGYYWTGAPDFAAAYHTYTLEWYPRLARFFVDGVQYYEFRPDMLTGPQPWFLDDHPFFFILNVAVGGVYGLPPDGTTPWPGQMTTDYVRHWHDLGQLKPFGGAARAVPGTIQAEDFDLGGEGVAYHDSNTFNSGASAYRTWEGVDLEPCSDAGAGVDVGFGASTEWLAYTVNVAQAGNYRIDARVANGAAGGTFHLAQNGVDISGPIAVPATGGWQSWVTVSKSGIALKEGIQPIYLVMDSPQPGNLNWLSFTLESVTSNCGSPSPTLRVNCGGPNFNDGGGDLWSADQAYGGANTWGYVGGATSLVGTAIGNTTDDTLFRSDRYGMSEYRFDVPAGRYRVRLRFAETFHTLTNKRRFYVGLEGKNVIGDMDIFDGAGGANLAFDEVRYVDVSDGTLNINFLALMDQPKVCAIEVTDTKFACTPTPTSTSYAGTPTITATPSVTPSATPTVCAVIFDTFEAGSVTALQPFNDGTSALSSGISTAFAYSGIDSLRVSLTTTGGTWGAGLNFGSNYYGGLGIIDATGHPRLSYWIKTDKALVYTVRFREGLAGENGGEDENWVSVSVNTPASAAWQNVSLDLSAAGEDLNNPACSPNCATQGDGVRDFQSVKKLELLFNTGISNATVYLDQFQFEPLAGCSTPTPTPTHTRTPTPTLSYTASPTRTATASSTSSISPSPSASRTATASVTPTLTASPTRSATASASPSASPTSTVTGSNTPSATLTATPTSSSSPTSSPSATPSATASITPSPSATPTMTPSPTPSATLTVSPSISPTFTDVPPGSTATLTPSITATSSATASVTLTSSASATPTPSVTASSSPTATPSVTPSPSITPSASNSASPSSTETPFATVTPTLTATPSLSPSNTSLPTATITVTLTNTPPAPATPTLTATPLATATSSVTPPASASSTSTLSPSPPPTGTGTSSPSSTPSVTATPANASTPPAATATPTAKRGGPPRPRSVLAVPNPQAGAVLTLAVDLEYDADSLLVQTYTKAMTCLALQELRGPFHAGWNSVSLPLSAPSNGLYYLLVTGKLDSGESAVGPAGKLLVIR